MDAIISYHHVIEWIISTTGMSDKLLHVHVGLAIYLLYQVVMRDRRASVDGLLLVFCLELTNELLDRLYLGWWNWGDTASDFAFTLFWPTAIFLVGRYRRHRWQMREEHRARIRALFAVGRSIDSDRKAAGQS